MKASAKFLLIISLIVIFSSAARVAPLDAKSLVYQGYCSNDVTQWTGGIGALKTAYASQPEDPQIIFELIRSQYGYIGFRLAMEDEEVESDIDKALALTDVLSTKEGYASSAEAFRGALLALKIGLKPIRALILGPKSEKALKRALELDRSNPVAWVEMGNMKFHAPGIFGGSNEEAIQCFTKAIALFDQNPAQKINNWQYLHSVAWLGKAYERAENFPKAIEVYKRALRIAPNFLWVKKELLPDAQKKR
ncbi:MAG: tetratricopeptide repeat protein [Bacteroidia bacterium]